MRIALNAQLLSTTPTYRSAGISRVIYELLAHLRAASSPDQRYVVYAPRSPDNRRFLRAAGLPSRLTALPTDRPPARIAWEQTVLPLELARTRADLLHALGFVAPFAWRGPTVVTVYDLSFMRFPELFNRGNRLYLRTFTPPSLRRADRVITISEHTKRDVVELCGVPPERVTPILLAADPRFRPAPPDEVAAFRARKGLPDRFILYLGTLEPRKNVETLVRAYAELRRRGITDCDLVLAGARGWQYEPVFQLVESLGLGASVHFPGFVADAEQALWYSGAVIFAYPSLYEGFGLPLLEAMACGTPVVASRSSSLPEVVGEAGVLVNPSDSHELSAALYELLVSDERRASLRSAGLARARTFSWRRMANETVQVYREVLAR
ncbi:MAG: glycosyltransferase family 4 protein [Chloroflexota bacterium]|nr:glycosyltransferase family 4 protein [Chloroflexota bacterium]